ncbi:HAD-IIIC family phosphatase [Gammaproteobacteria bacterium]
MVAKAKEKEHKIKCLIWDLDNTLWRGTLLEDQEITPFPAAVELIKTLDERGILQSVASKNDHALAEKKLREIGLFDYFLYPQINWNAKSQSLQNIATLINIGIDTIAFIDDQAFEREEVNFSYPQVLVIDAAEIAQVANLEVMQPYFITEDSRRRREMYQSDLRRKEIEESFNGPQDAFLETLGMVLTITRARQDDLKRAEELTQRTNQLNTTAYTYDYDELTLFSKSPNHLLLVAGLDDKYGTYGKIGLVLVEKREQSWLIKLLLMSCRVMSRGVGTVMINYLRNLARTAGVSLEAEFIQNDRNRMMYMTYKFTHFQEKEKRNNWILLENDLSREQAYPHYMRLVTD